MAFKRGLSSLNLWDTANSEKDKTRSQAERSYEFPPPAHRQVWLPIGP